MHFGGFTSKESFDVTCPGHDNCTATLTADENLSEFDIGKDIGKQFGSQNVAVRHVVTDGDARSAEGVRAGMSVAGMPCEQVDRQADTTHIEQALFRNVMKATFSERMFPGATAAIRKEQRKMFALDVKVRCHRIHSDMHRKINVPADRYPPLSQHDQCRQDYTEKDSVTKVRGKCTSLNKTVS